MPTATRRKDRDDEIVWFAPGGARKAVLGSPIFENHMNYSQIGAEQLFRGVENIDTSPYWMKNNCAVTKNPDGSYLLSPTLAGGQLFHIMHSYMPLGIPGMMSMDIEFKADAASSVELGYLAGGWGTHEGEIVSGPGSINTPTGLPRVTGLSTTEWTRVRVWRQLKGAWNGSQLQPIIYPGTNASGPGDSVLMRYPQACFGNEIKPRYQYIDKYDPDYWFAAWRPHNRLTADGKARTMCTDSQMLLSVGKPAYARYQPLNGGAILAPQSGEYTFLVDYVADASVDFYYWRTDASNHMAVTFQGTNITLSKSITGSTWVPVTVISGVIAGGSSYHVRIRANPETNTHDLYLDDELLYSEVVTTGIPEPTDEFRWSTAGTSVLQKLLTEHYPKETYGIIGLGAADQTLPNWGDPRFYMTAPNGLDLFECHESHAVDCTVKQYDIGGSALSIGTTANLLNTTLARWGTWFNTDQFVYESYISGERIQYNWDTEERYVLFIRGRAHFNNPKDFTGMHMLQSVDGGPLKRFKVTEDWWLTGVGAPNVAVGATNFSAFFVVSHIALVDYSATWKEDFSTVLAYKAIPAALVDELLPETRTGAIEITVDMTRPAVLEGANVIQVAAPDDTNLFYFGSGTTTANLTLYDYVEGTTLLNFLNVLNAGTTTTVKCTVDESGLCTIYAGGVWKGEAQLSAGAYAAIGKLRSLLGGAGETQADRIANPFPALGMAASRAIYPATNDIRQHTKDAFSVFRNVILPGSGGNYVTFGGKRQVPGSDYIDEVFAFDGAANLANYRGGAFHSYVFTTVAGTVNTGDDTSLVLDGADAELFVAGNSVAIGSNADARDGEQGDFSIGGGATQQEEWPREQGRL